MNDYTLPLIGVLVWIMVALVMYALLWVRKDGE